MKPLTMLCFFSCKTKLFFCLNLFLRCGGCSDGWFDMGGAAWYDLTNNMPPGHVYGVKSRYKRFKLVKRRTQFSQLFDIYSSLILTYLIRGFI